MFLLVVKATSHKGETAERQRDANVLESCGQSHEQSGSIRCHRAPDGVQLCWEPEGRRGWHGNSNLTPTSTYITLLYFSCFRQFLT